MALYLASWLMLTLAGGVAAPDAQAPPTSPPAPEAPPAPPAAPGPPAEEPSAAADMVPTENMIRRIDLGLSGPESDTNSSRFREYRELPSGPVVPYLRLAGGTNHRYDIAAANLLQEDARYRVYVEPGPLELDATYVRIPHRFGNEARSLLERTGPGTFNVEDTLQQSFQNSNQMAHSSATSASGSCRSISRSSCSRGSVSVTSSARCRWWERSDACCSAASRTSTLVGK